LARLEPASGLIAAGVRPGTRVDRVLVKEGDEVSAGFVLAILEGREAAERQLALAKAQKQRAEHQRAIRKEALAIQRVQSDQTGPARLEAAQKVAAASKERFKKGSELFEQFGGTLKGKERYDAEMALFQVQVQSIKADLDLRLLQAGIEAESKKRAVEEKELAVDNPEIQTLNLQIELAEAGLKETEVRAPVTGRVLRVLAHPGEISSGTLLEMGDVTVMVATAEVYQSDVPRIQLGDSAEVNILGQRVSGRVARIVSIVGRNQLTSVDPRALRDMRVVDVTIQLDRSILASRYVNMEVEAEIHPSGAAPTPTRGTSITDATRPGRR
jgi:HlyD family secretion protein